MPQPKDSVKALFEEIIQQNVAPDAWSWLQQKAAPLQNTAQFNMAFATLPRKVGKAPIRLSEEQQQRLQALRPHMSLEGWTADRLCRVWLLLQLDATDKERYFKTVENLFLSAEMSELVALYSALPVLPYPELWVKRCAEGIRSNIGDVLQAIMCGNPYPAEQLPEAAWNQLVLKAFFTDKPIHWIVGLDQRTNQELANTLSDYAHERWAAGRSIHPQLWRCVGPFINDRIFPDIERIANSENTIEREAAALACYASSYPPAKALLNRNNDLKTAIETGELTWDTLAQKAVVNSES